MTPSTRHGSDFLGLRDIRNSSNGSVDGRCDLINFLPVAVDVGAFATNWKLGAIYYRLEADSGGVQSSKIAFVDVDWTRIGETPFGTRAPRAPYCITRKLFKVLKSQIEGRGGKMKNYCHMPLEKEDYWVFRVREVKDSKGNLLSANYGKIYGMIRVFDHFHYNKCYFNTTPNDTNLEEKIPWLQSYYTNSTDTVLGPK